MAFTSIKVREEDKREFDRLLHELALRTGESVAHHELFHSILEHALASKERVLAKRTVGSRRSWAKFQFSLPEATDAASEIDRVVYGLDP